MLGVGLRCSCLLMLLTCCKHGKQEQSHSASAASASSVGIQAPVLPSLRMPEHEGPRLGLAPELHAVGQHAVARDYTMKVLEVAPCQVEPHFAPKPGYLKLGVEVELVGTSTRAVAANPFLATLVDSEQRDYGADLAGCTPTLHATRVTRDQRARGMITFEIPEGASGLVMIYAPFVVGAGSETLHFSLGR